MNSETFHHVCAGVNAVILAGGVILGGIWTRHVYKELKQEDTAAYQLFTSQANLQSLRLQIEEAQEKSRRAFGLLTLATTPLSTDRHGRCFMQVNVTVQNAGTREIRLTFGGDTVVGDTAPPLNVAQVLIDSRNHYQFRPLYHLPVHSFTPLGDTVLPLPESSLLPGESSTYPFLLRLPSSGMYLLQFRIPVDTARITGKPDTAAAGWYWTARSYIPGCRTTTSSAYASPARTTE